MKLRTGDQVKVTTGKDKGKTGKIIQAFPEAERVVVEGVNITTRHLRNRGKKGDKGQKISFAAPIHSSNVQVFCSKCGRYARIGSKALADGKKVRTCVKCKEAI